VLKRWTPENLTRSTTPRKRSAALMMRNSTIAVVGDGRGHLQSACCVMARWNDESPRTLGDWDEVNGMADRGHGCLRDRRDGR